MEFSSKSNPLSTSIRVDENQRAGNIDFFDGEHISGWVIRGNSGHCSLYINSTFVMDIHTDIVRNDVNETYGLDGQYGFEVNITGIEYNTPDALVVLREGREGTPIAWRFFRFADVFPPDKAVALTIKLASERDTLNDALTMLGQIARRMEIDPANFKEIADAESAQIFPELWLEAGRICEASRNFDSAEQFYRMAFSLAGIQKIEKYADQTIDNGDLEHNLYMFLLSKMVTYKIAPDGYAKIMWIFNIFKTLISFFPHIGLQFMFYNFIANYIAKDKTKYCKRIIDIFTDRIALLAWHEGCIGYLKSVLAHFPFLLIDILFWKKVEPNVYNDVCKKYSTRILDSFKDVYKYNMLIYDINLESVLGDKFIEQTSHAIKIGYTHGMIFQIPNKITAHLIVMPTEKYVDLPTSLSRKYVEEKDFSAMMQDHESFCQLAYTGPYHFGSHISNKVDRKELKAIAADKLKHHIPENRPLIVCYEAGAASQRQIIYAVNRLAKHCTVVFKKYKLSPTKYLHLLHPDVILFDEGYQATNWLRFAADYVLCEFFKSTFQSCILLGQYCLPFYTKIMNGCAFNIPKSFSDVLKGFKTFKNISFLYDNWKYIFDITKIDMIENAIFGKDYKNWYDKNIDILRSNLFGDFVLSGCDQKTYNIIMRYICEGTLGNDCSSLLIHCNK